jgi:hypothetical protein
MAERKAETRPISPDKAADALRDAGKVSGLAQIAILSHADEIAAVQSARLNRESMRLARKYGPQSREALAAGLRVDQHKSYRSELAQELDRATLPVPAADPAAAIIYGRVFSADGKPQAKSAVEVLDASGKKVLGRAVTGSDGAYLIKLSAQGGQNVTVRAVAPKTQTPAVESDAVRIVDGTRVFRDLRIAAVPTPPKPPSSGSDTPPTKLKMPDLVGLSEKDAAAALARLGISSITVTTDTATSVAPGTVLKQTPAQGTTLKSSTKVALVVSARAPIKIPDLGKMTLKDATIVLNQLGLKVGKVTGDQTKGKITGQTPAPGEEVAAGATVDIKLGRAG